MRRLYINWCKTSSAAVIYLGCQPIRLTTGWEVNRIG